MHTDNTGHRNTASRQGRVLSESDRAIINAAGRIAISSGIDDGAQILCHRRRPSADEVDSVDSPRLDHHVCELVEIKTILESGVLVAPGRRPASLRTNAT